MYSSVFTAILGHVVIAAAVLWVGWMAARALGL